MVQPSRSSTIGPFADLRQPERRPCDHDAVVTVTGDPARALALADDAEQGFDVDAAVAHLSAAVRGFTAAGDCRRAALACARLGNLYANALGNLAGARAWFLRASRLVADEPPCLEQGWVAAAPMGCDVDDPADLLARSELALDRARRFGDVNLETKALADAGLAHVQSGRLELGMDLLDEAMALACGTADDRTTAAKSVCSFLTACYLTADFDRASTWSELLGRHGLTGAAADGPAFVRSHCDSLQATLLVELGRWGEAEAVLVRAMADFEAAVGMPSWHPAIALAELRIRQGRLAEAEVLLLGKEGSLQALLPAARLHLERGDHDLARATASRGLRATGDDRLRAAELWALLVDTELAAGDLAAAQAAGGRLQDLAAPIELAGLRARAGAVQARVMAASGDPGRAIGLLEGAVDELPPTGTPFLRASLVAQLAGLHHQVGNRAAARVEAGRALATLAGLDAVLPAAEAATLARFGAGAGAGATRSDTLPAATLEAHGRWWEATAGGTCVRLRDTKGLRYLAELVARPGVERHALDLVDLVEGTGQAADADRHRLGDAGEMLDAGARSAYRHRIEALRAEIDDALARGDEGAAELLQGEVDQLVGQLAQAFGLGGRSRRAASAAERARLNVTRALRASLARLADALPEAGAALDRSVRTGTYCAYEPDGSDPRWTLRR